MAITDSWDSREVIGSDPNLSRSQFSQAYVDAVFMLWYSKGKPSYHKLAKIVPDPNGPDFNLSANYPSESTLKVWVNGVFKDRAAALDDEVSKQMAERLIAEKVQMLESHVVIASKMQEIALNFLNDEEKIGKMNAMAAIRLLVEGVRIERESRGIPRTLEKMANISDTDLLKDINDLLLMAPTEFESLDSDITDAKES